MTRRDNWFNIWRLKLEGYCHLPVLCVLVWISYNTGFIWLDSPRKQIVRDTNNVQWNWIKYLCKWTGQYLIKWYPTLLYIHTSLGLDELRTYLLHMLLYSLQWRHNGHDGDYSDAEEGEHQSSASLAFVRGIHRSPVNSPHKWPVTRKMFPFDNFIMFLFKYRYQKLLEMVLLSCWVESYLTTCNWNLIIIFNPHIDWLVQEGRNSIANALELCLSCTKLSKWSTKTRWYFSHSWAVFGDCVNFDMQRRACHLEIRNPSVTRTGTVADLW